MQEWLVMPAHHSDIGALLESSPVWTKDNVWDIWLRKPAARLCIYTYIIYLTLPYITLHCLTFAYMTLHDLTWLYMTLHTLTLPYISLHDLTWPYMTLHCLTFPYITLHDLTWPEITLHYLTLQSIPCHAIALHTYMYNMYTCIYIYIYILFYLCVYKLNIDYIWWHMIQYYMYLYRSNLSGIAIFLVALVAHGGSKVPQLTLDDFGVLAMAPSRVPKVTFPARSVSFMAVHHFSRTRGDCNESNLWGTSNPGNFMIFPSEIDYGPQTVDSLGLDCKVTLPRGSLLCQG